MITLRPYQLAAVTAVRAAFANGFRAPLYVAPTGSGKTRIFSHIAESSQQRGKRVLILCHRVELVDQIVAALEQCNVTPDIIAASYQRSCGRERAGNRAVAVASVQTLIRRLGSYAPPTLIIADEAHHFARGNTFSEILRHYSTARRLGVTATAIRHDGRGLAATFDHLIMGPQPHELMEEGYLVRARVFAPPGVDTSGLHIRMGDYQAAETEALMDAPSITGDALSHYKQHARDKGALVFCTSVAHAHHVAERFRADGIEAVALDGGTDREVRRRTVQEFRDGRIKVLTNCDLFGEGFDLDGIHCAIMLRPTTSLALYLQQCGRALRPAPGKEYATILDHAGNSRRFGLPDEPREWELTDDVMRIAKPKKSPPRVCVKCFASSPSRAVVCVECGHAFEVKERQVEEKEGELREVRPLTPEELAKKRERQTQGMAHSLAQLQEIGRIKGRKPGWALHVWEGRMAKRQKESA
jgi:superfamily II DNA or RNA helicase